MRPDRVIHRFCVLLTAVALAGCGADANLADEVPAPSIHPLGEDAGTGIAPAWTSAGTMNSRRRGHTATLLPSGRVLVTGGYNAVLALSSAEEYDPQKNTWAPVGSMHSPRSHHTATLLPDGRVLVAGGYMGDLNINAESAPISSVEIYDPVSQHFTTVKSMSIPRGFLTATLLTDGRVLATGGIWFVSSTATKETDKAEVYDPATDTWTSTPPMSHQRGAHAAVLLHDGSVLVAGGYDGSQDLVTTERFIPDTGGFVPAAEMGTSRERFDAALLLDGRVLVTAVAPAPEIYDPSSDQWSPTPPMAAPTDGPPTRLLDGRLLAAGGFKGGNPLKSAEVFDPVAGAWFPVSSMTDGRKQHTVTVLLDGRVLMAGGDALPSTGALDSAELFGPKLGGEACGKADECQSGSCTAGVCTCGSVHDCASGLTCDPSHRCGPPLEDSTGISGCTAAKAVGNGVDAWAALGLAVLMAMTVVARRWRARQ